MILYSQLQELFIFYKRFLVRLKYKLTCIRVLTNKSFKREKKYIQTLLNNLHIPTRLNTHSQVGECKLQMPDLPSKYLNYDFSSPLVRMLTN